MRWFLVAILAYACLVLQTSAFLPGALAVPIDHHWTRPNLLLLLGLFIALNFTSRDVFLAAWCLGLAADLAGVSGRLGLQAILYCAALSAVAAVRNELPRTRLLTQVTLSFALVAVVHFLWYAATLWFQEAPLAILRPMEQALFDAAYTAILAPYVFWGLYRLRGPLGVAMSMPRK